MNQNSKEQNEYQAGLLANRLAKKYKVLKKWARRERVTCYRLYDKDIPEIPLAIDLYEFVPEDIASAENAKIECARFLHDEDARISANDAGAIGEKKARTYLHIYLYERPYEKDDAAEEEWLSCMTRASCRTIGIDESHALTKVRKKQKGENQYEKLDSPVTLSGVVQERGQLFKVNLSDYLDTGLFLDHRPLRAIVRSSASGKSVLNLFCYTASFSVYAAEGKARRVESVDLSNTYMEWAKDNFSLNGFPVGGAQNKTLEKYVFTRGDVTGFLNQKLSEVPNEEKTNRYDIIILDPPTFSNSKATRATLDINRDWIELVAKCTNLLNPHGCLYFSTNSKRLKFDEKAIPQLTKENRPVHVEEITADTLDEDFKTGKIHRCWKIEVGAQ